MYFKHSGIGNITLSSLTDKDYLIPYVFFEG